MIGPPALITAGQHPDEARSEPLFGFARSPLCLSPTHRQPRRISSVSPPIMETWQGQCGEGQGPRHPDPKR
jgi:hypothetical protein